MLTIACLQGEVILGVDTHRDTHAIHFASGSRCPGPRRRLRGSPDPIKEST